jgi:hypothetical protein
MCNLQLTAQVQAGELLQERVCLPAYILLQKELYVKPCASSPHYHRALLRHAAPDSSVLDIRIIQGKGEGEYEGGCYEDCRVYTGGRQQK